MSATPQSIIRELVALRRSARGLTDMVGPLEKDFPLRRLEVNLFVTKSLLEIISQLEAAIRSMIEILRSNALRIETLVSMIAEELPNVTLQGHLTLANPQVRSYSGGGKQIPTTTFQQT